MRAICDTNVVVSALLFESGRCSWLREAWRTGRIVPIVDAATADELLRVLEYPKFRLSPSDRDEILAEYLPFTEIASAEEEGRSTDVGRAYGDPARTVDSEIGDPPDHYDLRDPDDRIFLELAIRSRADALVTGDADLLALAGTVPFEVLTPAQALERM